MNELSSLSLMTSVALKVLEFNLFLGKYIKGASSHNSEEQRQKNDICV